LDLNDLNVRSVGKKVWRDGMCMYAWKKLQSLRQNNVQG